MRACIADPCCNDFTVPVAGEVGNYITRDLLRVRNSGRRRLYQDPWGSAGRWRGTMPPETSFATVGGG